MTQNPLRTYREKHKLTQAELAAKLGVSPAMITHIETGFRGISPKRAIDIERKLGIPRALLRPDIFCAA